jgi:hypothetical protein
MLMQIKKNVIEWIPNEQTYIQPTYQALNILWVLKNIQIVDEHIEFVLKFQKS